MSEVTTQKVSHLRHFARMMKHEGLATESVGQVAALGAVYVANNPLSKQTKAAEHMLAKTLTPFLSKFSATEGVDDKEAAAYIDKQAKQVSRKVMDFATIVAGEALSEIPMQTFMRGRGKESKGKTGDALSVTKGFFAGKAAVATTVLVLQTVFGKQLEAAESFVADGLKWIDAGAEEKFNVSFLGKDAEAKEANAERYTELLLLDVGMIAIDWAFRYKTYVADNPRRDLELPTER